MLRFDRGKVLVWYMGTEGKMHIINKECIGTQSPAETSTYESLVKT